MSQRASSAANASGSATCSPPAERRPLAVGQQRDQRVGGGRQRAHPLRASALARHDQRGLRDRREARRRPAVAEAGRVVGERRRQRLQRRPERRPAGGLDALLRHFRKPHEVRERVAATAGGEQRAQFLAVGTPARGPARVDVVRHLVHGQALDRHAGRGGLERQRPAAGDPDHEARLERREVLELARERVGRRVPTLPATTAVVVDRGEPARRELPRERRVLGPVGRSAADEHHARAGALARERDRRAVGGADHAGTGGETVISEPTASDRWLGSASPSHAHSGP